MILLLLWDSENYSHFPAIVNPITHISVLEDAFTSNRWKWGWFPNIWGTPTLGVSLESSGGGGDGITEEIEGTRLRPAGGKANPVGPTENMYCITLVP